MSRPRKTHGHKQLPFETWPRGDQEAWAELFRAGDVFDGRGTAWSWKAGTRRTNQKNYGRWLSWLATQGRLDDRAPWERASQEAVTAYGQMLLADVKPVTAASYLIGLKCVLQKMAPNEDWSWLRELTELLDNWAKPSRAPRTPDLTLPEMFERALAELDRLSQIPTPRPRDLWDYRDTLIVALLIPCPVRLRNLTMMQVGQHLVSVKGTWHLRFEAHETKTAEPLHLVVHSALTGFIDDYLARIRPAFPGAATHTRVWAAQKGKPMAHESIYARVLLTTKRLFGTAVNPHGFRSLAATLLAESSPEDALHARSLLGHRLPETTERYYIRASQLEATRKVSAALQGIRDGNTTGVG